MSAVMKLEEVAEYLKVHSSTIYRLLRDHKIPAFKMGNDWRFNKESIDHWIEEREAEQR
jgi:excisionase family DNA binding protein